MKRFTALLLTLVLMIGCVNGVSAAEANLSHTYQLVVADCTWLEAFQNAQDAGGYLATFDSPGEYQTVLDMIENQGLTWKIFWIGGRRDFDSYEYYWVDSDNDLIGDPLNDSSSWVYYEWLSGEPSYQDQGIPEYCIDLFYSTTENRFVLNDAPNDIIGAVPSFSGKVGYIIEYDYVYYPPSAGYDWYYPDSYSSDDYDDYQDSYEAPEEYLPSLPSSFTFTSGAGGWSTDMVLKEDGTFTGSYSDWDLGADTDSYPGGTCYVSEFSGRFSNFYQIDPYTWCMELESLNYAQEPGTEYTEGDAHYLVTEAYGLAGGSTFCLYLPGHPVDTLPEEFMSWAEVYMGYTYPDHLTIYGLYNEDTGQGWGGNW